MNIYIGNKKFFWSKSERYKNNLDIKNIESYQTMPISYEFEIVSKLSNWCKESCKIDKHRLLK